MVGRPFPPMNEHLRVSVGTADEMQRFMTRVQGDHGNAGKGGVIAGAPA